MPQKSKVKTDVYQDAPVSSVSQAIVASGNSRSISLEKGKKQAEEPIYLNRV